MRRAAGAGMRLAFALCALAAPAARPASAQEAPRPVRLRAGDSVRLEVRDEPTLTGEYRVDEGGRVMLPLIGLIAVAGRDFDEVRRDVDEGYAGELRDLPVRVTPLMRIAVLGEVRLPSLYPVDPTYSLMDVIALAGGLGPSADPRHVSLVRDGRSNELTLRPGESAFDVGLRSGDQVVVGRRGWARENLVALITTGASIAVALSTALILR